MIRLILVGLILILYFIAGIVVIPVIWIAKLFKAQNAADKIAHFYVRAACRLAWIPTGLKVDAKGVENIPQDRAALYVVNHRSAMFDPVTIYPFLKRPAGFIAKKELEKIPYFAYWLKLSNSLFIDRKNIREGYKTIQTAIEKLTRGVSMLIFPEGTRNKDKESKTSMLPFHDASFKPAQKANVPVVPVTLYNTADSFENHKPKITKNHVMVVFGKPVLLRDLDKEESRHPGAYFQNIIQDTLFACEEEFQKRYGKTID